MKKLLLLIMCSMFLFSCSSDDDKKTECETKNIGYVTIDNKSNFDVHLLIDGQTYAPVKKYSKHEKEPLTAGKTYRISLGVFDYNTQKYNYLFNQNIEITQCSTKNIVLNQ